MSFATPEPLFLALLPYGWLLLVGIGIPMLMHWLIERTAPPGFHIYAEGMEGYRGSFADPVLIFGPGPDRIQPMKALFPTAIAAEMAHFPDGSRTLAVAYPEMEDAEKAVARWGSIFVMRNITRRSGTIIYTTDQGEQQALLMFQGCFLLAFYAPTEDGVLHRRRSCGAIYETSVPSWRLAWLRSRRVALFVLGAWALLQGFLFYDMRLAVIERSATADAVAALELIERYTALSRADAPILVRGDIDAAGRAEAWNLVVEWRIDQGRWLDFLRIDGPPLAERVMIELDAERHMVRSRRFQRLADWSDLGEVRELGAIGWSAEWWPSSRSGHEAARDVMVRMNGSTPEFVPGHTWSFAGAEIEATLEDVALASGWRWAPQMALSWPVWLPRPGSALLSLRHLRFD